MRISSYVDRTFMKENIWIQMLSTEKLECLERSAVAAKKNVAITIVKIV